MKNALKPALQTTLKASFLSVALSLSGISFAQNPDLPSASSYKTDPDLVAFVDVSKYAGLWYEIAAIPKSFQSFCQFTTAEYTVTSPIQLAIANKCKVGFVPVNIYGTATVIDSNTNAVLQIAFENVSKKGDYRIVGLADDYSTAVVTNENRDSLFILARSPSLPDDVYAQLLDRAAAVGIDVSKIKKTKQK
jgi:apolipoprotein D and lipocalin family protein